jgi:hypothetical protein
VLVIGINVVFDDVEREVVGAGERQNRDRQERDHPEARMLQTRIVDDSMPRLRKSAPLEVMPSSA